MKRVKHPYPDTLTPFKPGSTVLGSREELGPLSAKQELYIHTIMHDDREALKLEAQLDIVDAMLVRLVIKYRR